jgi:hypothetical protein
MTGIATAFRSESPERVADMISMAAREAFDGAPGAILGAVLQAASGRIKQDQRQAHRQWTKKLTVAEAAATEKLMPLFKSNTIPIHPHLVAYELNEFLADNTISIGDGGDVVTISAHIAPALLRARESLHRLGRSAVINIWVDPREYAPGTKNQTMYN